MRGCPCSRPDSGRADLLARHGITQSHPNDEHVDVLVARQVSTVDGVPVAFDDVWSRRQTVDLATGIPVALPCLDDLILAKRFAARPRDAEDVRLLQVLRSTKSGRE